MTPSESILVYLPDNPEEKSLKRVSFAKKRDAIPFFNNAFFKTHQFIDDLASALGFQLGRLKQSILTEQLGELKEGKRRTLALIMPGTEGDNGIELCQTEDQRLYVRTFRSS